MSSTSPPSSPVPPAQPAPPAPSFTMHHSIILPHACEIVYEALSSPNNLERLQRLTPFVSSFTRLPSDTVSLPPSLTSALPDPSHRPSNLPRPLDLHRLTPPDNTAAHERTNFSFSGQPLSFLPSFLLPHSTTIVVTGSQLALPHLSAVLFESEVKKSGIRELKLRVCTPLDDVEIPMTQVEETIWGTAPAITTAFLKGTGLAARTHRHHMENYHKLFEHETRGEADAILGSIAESDAAFK